MDILKKLAHYWSMIHLTKFRLGKLLLIFCGLLLLPSCFCAFCPPGPRFREYLGPEEFTEEAEEVSESLLVYASKLKFEKKLLLENSQWIPFYGRKRLHLLFITQNIMDLVAARALLVDVVEGLMQEVPIGIYDIRLEIRFESFYVKFVDPLEIGRVVLSDGVVYYHAGDFDSCDLECKHTRTENYEQSYVFSRTIREGDKLYKPLPPKPTEIQERFL